MLCRCSSQVDESMRASAGGGQDHDGEAIEVLALPFAEAEDFIVNPALPKSPGLQFGLLWAASGLASGRLPGRATLDSGPLTLKAVLPA